jgi:hypothetical protein
MSKERTFQPHELLNRPGTYFNPQTEVMVLVDDSPSLDQDVFDMEELEGAEWVLVSEEVPVDEARREQLWESFQSTRATESAPSLDRDQEEDEDEDDQPSADAF